MHNTLNDIALTNRRKLCDMLQQSVADCSDLASQARQAHWNVKGPNFIALHELFDSVYNIVGAQIDILAERMVQLGGQVQGTVRAAAKSSSLKEYPLEASSGEEHLKALSAALAAFGKSCRANIDKAGEELRDMDTADIYTEISREIDKQLWFVEAHMEGATAEARPTARRAAAG
ncbi:DNA starvation/stationary phase protection protein Dps [bacterium]|nr:DNA starvation/stationary phase protection protein Dps [bacterium]